MVSFTGQEKNQLAIFALVAFAVPYLSGIMMWYGRQRGYDLTAFCNAQMFYPAAGVMLAVLLTQRKGALRPKRFMLTYCLITALMLSCAVAAVLAPTLPVVALVNLASIGGSVLLWVMLLTEKKASRRAYGLTANAGRESSLCVCLFVALYCLRSLLSCVFSGEAGDFFAIFTTGISFVFLPFNFFINFFLVFAAFFGEEYGWRYFLQPLMQKRFGSVGGVLLAGMLWGIWHLPLNLFYYIAPGYELMSVLSQQILCVSLGIFISYAYMKTDNIWVPVILHYLNNNLIPVFSGSFDANIIANQTITWGELGMSLALNGVLFGAFLLAKPFRRGANRLPTLTERLENVEAETENGAAPQS